VKGHIDSCSRAGIAGWAIAQGDEPAELVVTADGEVVGAVRAQEFRADLNRRCGFHLAFARPLGHVKEVRVAFAGAGVELSNSPFDFRHRLTAPSEAELAWTQGLETPPVDQMRLIGSDTLEIFVAQGARTATVLRDHVAEFFGDIRPEHRILDFGCGVGRSLLPMSRRYAARWFGSDVNDRAIAYLQRAAPEVKTFVNAYDPPLPVADESFDCVISISIWTHLPIGLQLPWLAEIRRVLRRGGLALISTSGLHVMDVRRKRGDPGWSELYPEDLEAAGILYRPYANPSLRGVTSSYGLAAHHPEHVQRVWSTIMPVLKTSVRAIEAMQDLHMLTRL
jgi:SAM-dependent methyltransferase